MTLMPIGDIDGSDGIRLQTRIFNTGHPHGSNIHSPSRLCQRWFGIKLVESRSDLMLASTRCKSAQVTH